jgi:hypothetical protein
MCPPWTEWLPRAEIEALHDKALKGALTREEAARYHGHMLIEMAQMSAEDGMVMQIHAGSTRSTNRALADRFGPDMGADIPRAMNWVDGLDALFNRVGNDPRFRLIVFTLDEASYARELAPMAGHWPALRLGPPWWFHDSLNGIRRYFDAVVEPRATAISPASTMTRARSCRSRHAMTSGGAASRCISPIRSKAVSCAGERPKRLPPRSPSIWRATPTAFPGPERRCRRLSISAWGISTAPIRPGTPILPTGPPSGLAHHRRRDAQSGGPGCDGARAGNTTSASWGRRGCGRAHRGA